jgi:hypothetical protein
MRAIDQALVDEVWWEVTTYEGERATAEARVFLERQPYVGEICRQLMKEFDPEAQRAAMGLTFLLFKIVETSLGAPFPTISRERLIQAYEAITEWLEQWEGADPRFFLRSVQGGGDFPHPNLIQYLLTVFYGGDPESAEYDDEVKASLFLLLKTVADALDIAPVKREE